MYYTIDGCEICRDQIVIAVSEGRAVLVWSHGNWSNSAGLKICADADEAESWGNRDTRGECYSAWDEVWCEVAVDIHDACRAASGKLVTR